MEFARTVHSAGTDLLNLISDILDLSKVESGMMSVDAENVSFTDLKDMVVRSFRHEAESRNLSFDVVMDPSLERGIVTDSKRLQQVLKNLLSNAFKFTEKGGVRLAISAARGGWSAGHPTLDHARSVVAFEVSDTGIGIAPEKQKSIFEAFQQADASTSRKYGGTGLGLAISRELATLLAGEIQLQSTPGGGSVFTLYLPLEYAGLPATQRTVPMAAPMRSIPTAECPQAQILDDRANLQPDDAVLLIVEDDLHFANFLVDLAHGLQFKVLLADCGADALALAREYPLSAISLDVFLPDMLGWSVLSQLKRSPSTRHIPVQILTVDDGVHHGLARGAFSFVTKPANKESLASALKRIKEFISTRRKRLLLLEDNASERLSITQLLGDDDLDIIAAETVAGAFAVLREQTVDCIVLDLRLPDMSGFNFLERIANDAAMSDIPVVVFTGRELSPEEDAKLRTMARSVVIKGVESPERLLDETALFLHRDVTRLPVEKQRMLERLHGSDEDLLGKTILLVDDDARNIFALSSILERRAMRVVTATTGSEAITLLEGTPDAAIVLMDIMMPEMDGYETIRLIRRNPLFGRLPIVALTAKAMKGDREKCLEAGASDYLAKPVNAEQLVTTLRMWLHR